MPMLAEQVRWVPISDIAGWKEGASNLGASDAQGLEESQSDTVLLQEREEGGYTLLAGRERLLELQALGQNCVNAVVSPAWKLEEQISALLTRLLKGNVHYLDEAEEYNLLLKTELVTQKELAVRLGRSGATLQRKLRLLTLGEKTRQLLRDHQLSERHALAVLRIPGEQGRARMAAHAGEQGLTVKELEELVEATLARMPIPVPRERRMIPLMRDHRLYVNAIRGIVEQMRDVGLDASMQVGTGKTVVEVRIAIPCFSQPKRHA